jgi:hypothetical protein
MAFSTTEKNMKKIRREYPPRSLYPGELEQIQHEFKNLKKYNAEQALKCLARTKYNSEWHAILSCLIKDGMLLPHASRMASKVYGPAFLKYLSKKERVAATLTALEQLAHYITLQSQAKQLEFIQKILGGHTFPLNQLIPDEKVRNSFFPAQQQKRVPLPNRPPPSRAPLPLTCLDEIQNIECKEETTSFSMGEVGNLLENWMNRDPRFCHEGSLSFIFGEGTTIVRTSKREHPCATRYAYFRIQSVRKDEKIKRECDYCGLILVRMGTTEPRFHEVDCIFFQEIWDSKTEFAHIMKKIGDMITSIYMSPIVHVYETFLRKSPLLLGSLYFYASYISPQCEAEAVNRDQLIYSLEHDVQKWTKSWSCFMEDAMKDFSILKKSALGRTQPEEVKIHVQSGHDVGVECKAWNDLFQFAISCNEPLQENIYNRFQKYMTDFLSDMLSDVSAYGHICYGGEILLFSNVEEKWATIADSDYPLRTKCAGRVLHLTVLLINLQMGPFSDPNQNLNQFEDEYNTLKQQEKIKGHTMALLIDHDSKEIELYEPNGETNWFPLVWDSLQGYFYRNLPQFENFKWVSTFDFCPLKGPQAISGKAMCSYFSLLWIYLRIHCPDVSRENLLDSLLLGGKNTLEQLLKGLQCMLKFYADQKKR